LNGVDAEDAKSVRKPVRSARRGAAIAQYGTGVGTARVGYPDRSFENIIGSIKFGGDAA